MCSGGDSQSNLIYEQQRLARISSVKSKQRARKSSITILSGRGAKEYKRSITTGAKPMGTTAAQLDLRKLSTLFTGHMGEGARISARQRTADARTIAAQERYWAVGDGMAPRGHKLPEKVATMR